MNNAKTEILNIHCPSCGAPARFDIIHQIYKCSYCGGDVKIDEAKKENAERLEECKSRLKESAKQYDLMSTSCSGCGATLVFEEDEALSSCAFCGRSLVRKRYVHDDRMPQSVIPFGVTKEEAKEKLQDWCSKNSGKTEAKHLKEKISELKGFYLPYEMFRGPVACKVNKTNNSNAYTAHGYVEEAFINCSEQMDNTVLDAMEPFDLEGMADFDFAYVAGQHVKIPDLDSGSVKERLREEITDNYRPKLQKIMGTKAVTIQTKADPVIKAPVLLPAYYISDGNVCAAVNGQTGKVSVRAEKESTYIALPWWLKGIAILLLALAATVGAMYSYNGNFKEALFIAGVLGIFYLIVFVCMFEGGDENKGSITKYRNIFTSGEETYRRERGKLVLREDILKRRIAEPVFMRRLEEDDTEDTPVTYVFRSLKRVLFQIVLCVVAIFFPVILALILNGFNFARIDLSGSAVWYCIAVPTVPIYLIRFGIQWLYDSPWIYTFAENGKTVRWRPKRRESKTTTKEAIATAAGLVFVPPGCLITLFVIGSMIVMVYLTGFAK